MLERQPFLVAVAPNGARRSKSDLPQLPLSAEELASTALQSLEAGAAMIHLHVRDENGKHSILPEHYQPALERVAERVDGSMVIQVTSESAGVFTRQQQMRAMREVNAESMSIAIRELVPDEAAYEDAAVFFRELVDRQVMVQYILYSPDEVDRYHQLIRDGVIPRARNLVLFVLGRYDGAEAEAPSLSAYVDRNESASPWMCCAFGARELSATREAALLGGHARVGFENNTSLPSGSTAGSNSQLVALTAQYASCADRSLANAEWLRRLGNRLLVDAGQSEESS